MKTFQIKASLRRETGKKDSRKLRKQELVPCVLYGGEKNIHFAVVEKHFKNIVYSPEVYLVKLDIDGELYDAVMKDVQFHPVTDSIIHIDFTQVFSHRDVTLNLPIKLTGSSAGILAGGKLRQRRRSLKVKGLAEHIPDHLDVDITSLEIGDSFKVGDLKFDNLEVLDPARAMVVGVVSSRLVAKGMEEAVAEEAVAEETAAVGSDSSGSEGAGHRDEESSKDE